MGKRSLAHVERVINIRPIDGCDNIEQCNVLGWNLIIRKGEFQENDLCVYIEIDSIVPEDNPDFVFLEKRRFRVKTIKMRGVISQGIALPLSVLPAGTYEIGTDVTDILKIKKINDDIPSDDYSVRRKRAEQVFKSKHKRFFSNKFVKKLMKYKWFRKTVFLFIPKHQRKKNGFPAYIAKTDETRIQNIPQVLDECKGLKMIVTEKLDGMSATYGLEKIRRNKFDFAVCSRNVRQLDKDVLGNTYWEIEDKYGIEPILRDMQLRYGLNSIVIQGEIIGEGIQKNKYRLSGHDFYVFNLIFNGKKINSIVAKNMLEPYGLHFVPILEEGFELLDTVDEMLEYADGLSTICDTPREGVVIRNYDRNISFKCVSNEFLIKHSL